MPPTTTPTVEPRIADGVLGLVRQHDCEAELWANMELVRECFPDLRGLEVRLQPDPDEDGRVWVVQSVRLPASTPLEQVRVARVRYLEEKRRRFPFRFHPSFVVAVEFTAE